VICWIITQSSKRFRESDSVDQAIQGLFVTDFDGTLLGSDGSLSARDLDALESLKRYGIKTAIATGRSLYSFRKSPGADISVDYIIFSSGAGVINQSDNKLMYQVNISIQDVDNTLVYMRNTRFDFMVHYPVPDNHRFLYRRVSQDNTDFETRIERYRGFGQPLNSMPPGGFGEAAQFLAVVPQNKTDEALKLARNGLPDLSVIRSTSPLDHKSTWIELFHRGVSKSKTAAWLASELDVACADTAAIGNDYNDQDLLEWAALGFVVENTPAELKTHFLQVASNNDGGVADAVASWLDSRC
jgi:Cof subfamily protein (haloacid dehalogenase superfamily)